MTQGSELCDDTLNPMWCKAHSKRLLNWEYFRACLMQHGKQMSYTDMCDKIGVRSPIDPILNKAKKNYEQYRDEWVDDLLR